MQSSLLSSIESKQALIGIIGLGYVGLPLGLCFAEKGLRVIGFDVDKNKIDTLGGGRSYIRHISPERIKAVLARTFTPTTDFSKLAACNAILIAVPTPLTRNREPDLTYIVSTCEVIAKHLVKGQLVVLESTTYPGTTEEVVVPLLEKSGLKAGVDFFVAFSPEREDPGNAQYTTANIPKVVGSISSDGLAVAQKLYEQIVGSVVPVSSPRVAEAAKLLENIFRSVNIALVNELKVTFSRMGIDVWEVIEAAKTKPFGFMPFYPGPGLGGHCIPIDPFYLTWKAREYDVATRFIELAGEINTSMPDYVVGRVIEALNARGKSVRGSRILVLGLAYKPNVDDERESPSYKLLEKLQAKGAVVEYHDPHVPVIGHTREHPQMAGKKSVQISSQYDLFLIATAHDEYRKLDFKKLGVPVVDTRNILKDDELVTKA